MALMVAAFRAIAKVAVKTILSLFVTVATSPMCSCHGEQTSQLYGNILIKVVVHSAQ